MKRSAPYAIIASAVVLGGFAAFAYAAIPQQINYQSRLRTSAGVPVTAATKVSFSLYSALSGGSPVWTETYDQASGACKKPTPDADGYFSVALGGCAAFPASLTFADPLFLGVTIESDAEASPRIKFSASPYTMNAARLGTFAGDPANSKVVAETTGTATAGTAGFNSSALTFRGSGWNGSSAQTRDVTIRNIVTGAASSRLGIFNNAGVEIVSVLDSGAIGVGVTNPTGAMEVAGDFYADRLLVRGGTVFNSFNAGTNSDQTSFTRPKYFIGSATSTSDSSPKNLVQYEVTGTTFLEDATFSKLVSIANRQIKFGSGTLTFPAALPTSDGQVLAGTTAGALSWVDGSSGTVTSVGLALPNIFSVAGSPITSSGTSTATLVSQAKNEFFAAPDGVNGTPSFRAIVAADIPALSTSSIPNLDASKITTGMLAVARGGTGLSSYTANSLIYASGATTLGQIPIGSSGEVLTIAGGVPTWASLPGSGTVTSVGLVMNGGLFSIAGSPITGSGTSTASLVVQNPNKVFAGPQSGALDAAPTFRDLVAADIPLLSTSSIPNLDASKITSGTLNIARLPALASSSIPDLDASQITSGVFDAARIPTLASSSIPNLDASKIATGILGVPRGGTGLGAYTANGVLYAPTSGTVGQIAAGSSGEVLTLVSGVPTWQAIAGSGTVTSVGFALPSSVFSVSGSPITGSGTSTATLVSQTKNEFFAAPDGVNGTPLFRVIAQADIPLLSTSSIPNLDAGKITSGTLSVARLPALASSSIPDLDASQIATGVFPVARGGTGLSSVGADGTVLTVVSGVPTWQAIAGSGTVTSVGLVMNGGLFSIAGSPITGSGTSTASLVVQNPNKVFAGPQSGALDAAPTFRDLVAADIPLLSTSSIPNLDASKITSGTIAAARIPVLSTSSIPDLDADKITTGTFGTALIPSLDVSKIISGVFGFARGGLGFSTSTKGDIVYAPANNAIDRLPIGASGQILSVVSGVPSWTALSTSSIPNLDASKVTTGVLSSSTIPTLDILAKTSGVLPVARGGTGMTGLAKGDVLVGRDVDEFERLAAGLPGQVLTMFGGVPVWSALPASATVTSVGLALPSIFSVSGSPITSSGTTTATLATQTAKTFFAAPNGADGTPLFRVIAPSDVPTLNQDTTGTASNITGTLSAGSFPALSGDVTTSAGSLVTTIGTGKVTNAMLAGSIDASKISSGTFSLSRIPAGANNEVLTTVLGVPTWNALPASGDISGIGTTSTIAMFSGAKAIADSPLRVLAGNIDIASGGLSLAGTQRIDINGGAMFATTTISGGSFTANNVAIGGGAINSTVIGGTTPNAGTFNALTSTGNVNVGLSVLPTAVTAVIGSAGARFANVFSSQLNVGATTTINGISYVWPGSAPANGMVLTAGASGLSWAAGASGTVTSVGVTAPASVFATSSAITTNGNVNLSLVVQNPNKVFAGPQSGALDAAPTFRDLVAADIPLLASSSIPAIDASKIATGKLAVAQGGTGQGAYIANGVLFAPTASTIGQVSAGANGNVLTLNGSGAPVWSALPASGTVTSVGLTSTSSAIIVSGSPITTNGTTSIGFAGQAINVVLAGPASGSGGDPFFRSLVTADIPGLDVNKLTSGVLGVGRGGTGISSYATSSLLYALTGATVGQISPGLNGQLLTMVGGAPAWAASSAGTVSSVGLALPPSIFSVANSPIISSGTSTASLVVQNPNKVFAGPQSGALDVAPTFRALVAADIPALSTSSIPNLDASKISSGTFSLSRIPAGANNEVLTTVLGVPTWNALPASGDISGIGTTSTIAMFSGAKAIGNSVITQTGGNIDITSGSLLLGGVSRITGAGAATFATTTVSGTNLFTSNNVAIGGGSINGTTIGAATQSAGTFTTLSATGNLNVQLGVFPSLSTAVIGSPAVRFANVFSSQLNVGATTTINGISYIWPGSAPVNGTVLTSGASGLAWLPGASGTVTSVGLTSTSSVITVAGSPITTNGTTSIGLATQNANIVLAGPVSGGATTPTFRALVAADIPGLATSSITSGVFPVARGGTGLGSFTANGVLFAPTASTIGQVAAGANGNVLTLNGSGVPTWTAPVGETGSFTGNKTIIGDLTVSGGSANLAVNGNVTLGDAATDAVMVNGKFFSSLIPGTTDIYDLGTSLLRWKDIYVSGALKMSAGAGADKVLTSDASGNASWLAIDATKIATGKLAVAQGGTNLSSYTANGVLYAPTASTIGQVAAGSNGQVLTLNGSGVPTWATGGSIGGSGTSSTLPVFTASGTIGNSIVSQSDARTIGIAGTIFVGTGPGPVAGNAIVTSGMPNNTTGFWNAALGIGALGLNTTGQMNVAVGTSALGKNTTGQYNVASGYASLYNSTSGTYNIAIGPSALYTNVTGSYNVAVGSNALQTTTGDHNVAIGNSAFSNNTTGSNNTVVGDGAGGTSGGLTNTIMLGYNAQATKSNQAVIGGTGITETLLQGNVLSGTGATYDLGSSAVRWKDLYLSGSLKMAAGAGAGRVLTSDGSGNATWALPATGAPSGWVSAGGNVTLATTTDKVGIGTATPNNKLQVAGLINFDDLNQSTYVGYQAGALRTGNSANTVVGYNAYRAAGNGGSNTAVGSLALELTTSGNANTGVGLAALRANTVGQRNTAVGDGALQSNVSGDNSTAVGDGALSSATGAGNTAAGQGAFSFMTTGTDNAGFGNGVFAFNVGGSRNTAVGSGAGLSGTLTNTNDAVFIGYQALASANNLTNVIAIGSGAQATKSNQAVIGNASITETLLRGAITNTLRVTGGTLSAGSVLISDAVGNATWAAGASGTVTSVGLTSTSSVITVAGSPITTNGTTSIGLATQNANIVLAGPVSGGATTPTFRALVAADIPGLATSSITSGVFPVARGGTGLGSFTANGVLFAPTASTIGQVAAGANGNVLTLNGSGVPTWTAPAASGWGITGNAGTVDGTNFIGTTDSIPFAIRVNNQLAAKFTTNGVVMVSGGTSNVTGGSNAAVIGGGSNAATAANAVVVGGGTNTASGAGAAVIGSNNSTASGMAASVGGGNFNVASNQFSFAAGGTNNTASGIDAAVVGGAFNTAGATNSFVGGGNNNTVSGQRSAIAGGANLTLGADSFGASFDGSANVSALTNVVYFGGADVMIGNVGNAAQSLKFYEPNTSATYAGTNFTAFKAQAQGADIIYTLPAAGPTVSGQTLTATAAGVMSWATPAGLVQVFGSTNTSVASSMPSTVSGARNTAVGYSSMMNLTSGTANTAVGDTSLYGNTTGSYNTALGAFGNLYSNTTGGYNVSIGSETMYSNVSGSNNVAVGYGALRNNVSANGSVGVGSSAGLYGTGANNTAIGSGSGVGSSAPASITNTTALGFGAETTKSNQVVIGNASVTETVLSGNILPQVDNAQDLGSLTKRWRDIYVGPASIKVVGAGGAVIETIGEGTGANAGKLVVKGGNGVERQIGGAAAGNFIQGGNTFGNPAQIGTLDAYGVNIFTNAIARLSIASDGKTNFTEDATFAKAVAVGGTATFSGLIKIPSNAEAGRVLTSDASGSATWQLPAAAACEAPVFAGDKTITGSLTVNGGISSDLIPSAARTYNLGSAANPWRDIYVSSSTLKFVDDTGQVDATLSLTKGGDIVLENKETKTRKILGEGGGQGLAGFSSKVEDGQMTLSATTKDAAIGTEANPIDVSADKIEVQGLRIATGGKADVKGKALVMESVDADGKMGTVGFASLTDDRVEPIQNDVNALKAQLATLQAQFALLAASVMEKQSEVSSACTTGTVPLRTANLKGSGDWKVTGTAAPAPATKPAPAPVAIVPAAIPAGPVAAVAAPASPAFLTQTKSAGRLLNVYGTPPSSDMVWSNAGNGQSQASNSASALARKGQILSADNFGFSLPANASIESVTVTVARRSEKGTTQDDTIYLLKNGAIVGADLATADEKWPASANSFGSGVFVSPVGAFGLAPADVNGALSVGIRPTLGGTDQATVGSVSVTVKYSVP